MVELTAAHWVYAFFIIVILVTMALRKDTPLVCIVASFVLGVGRHERHRQGRPGSIQCDQPSRSTTSWESSRSSR